MGETCIVCPVKATLEMHGMAVCSSACATDVWNRINNDARAAIVDNKFKGPMDLAPLEIQELWQDLREYGNGRVFKDSRHRFDEFVFDNTLLPGYEGYARLKGEQKIYRVQKLNLDLAVLAFGGPGPFNRFVDSMMLQSHELSKQFPIDESIHKAILDSTVGKGQITQDGAVMIARKLEQSTATDFAYMVAPAIIDGRVFALVHFKDDAGGPGEELNLFDGEWALEMIFRLSFGRPRFSKFRILSIDRYLHVDGQVYGPLSVYTESILSSEPTIYMSWQLLRHLAYKKTSVQYEPYTFSDKMAFFEVLWQIALALASPSTTANTRPMDFFGLTIKDLKERDLASNTHLNEKHAAFVERVLDFFLRATITHGLVTTLVTTLVRNLLSSPIEPTENYFAKIKQAYVDAWLESKLHKVKRWPGAVINPPSAEKSSSEESNSEESSDEESSSYESSSEESSSEDEDRFEPHNAKRTRVVERRMFQ